MATHIEIKSLDNEYSLLNQSENRIINYFKRLWYLARNPTKPTLNLPDVYLYRDIKVKNKDPNYYGKAIADGLRHPETLELDFPGGFNASELEKLTDLEMDAIQ